MTDFEQFQRVVGTEKIVKLLQEVAKEAIDAGDWLKVQSVTDLVTQITEPTDRRTVDLDPGAGSPEMPLTALNVSNRCLELLKKAGVHTVSDLERYTLEGLLEINGVGEFAAQQIDSALQEKGITLQSAKLRLRWHPEKAALFSNLSDSQSGSSLPDSPVDESDDTDASLPDSAVDESDETEASLSDAPTF
jgi:hypothetical protein